MAESEEIKPQENELGTGNIGRLLFKYSLPAIVGALFNALYNVIDAAFLGQAFPDGTGVAVTTLGFPVMCILMGFGMLAGQGGNALAAIQMGAKQMDRVEKTLGNSAFLLFFLSAIVAVIAIVFIDPVLVIIGTPQELWEPTKVFVQIVCIFSAFQALGMGLGNFIRTAGRPILATGSMMFGTAMCIVFNYLFVLKWGWGVAGSAFATVAGQLCATAVVLWFFIFSKKAPFKLRLRCVKPDWRLIREIAVMGLASFVMEVAATFVNIVFNHVVTAYGAADPLGATGALAGLGVAAKVSFFFFTPMIGISMGGQPIIGYNYGAQDWKRVMKAFFWACASGACFGAFATAIVFLFPHQIALIFGADEQIMEFAATAMRFYVVLFTCVGYQAVASSYFQSSGQPIKSAILEMSRQIIFLIPFYLFLPKIIARLVGCSDLMGVVFCTPLSDFASFVLTTVFVVIEVRKLRRWRDGLETPTTVVDKEF